MKTDIQGLSEIKILVDRFYAKIRKDELLAPIFIYRLSEHWEPHLERMYSFWNAALFGEKGYNGNPFIKHATMKIGPVHFDRWISLFNETVDENFEGAVAMESKKRALIMATMFQNKLDVLKESKSRPLF